ncbi:MAG: LuxR C-terminal-related transcriptional regulator [Treponema sp.]|nr:LuxR C-terminal-related transcriptional regulator [Treponema sp.]
MSKNKFWRLVAVISGLLIFIALIGAIISVHDDVRKYYILASIPLLIFLIISEVHQLLFPLDLRIYIIWTFIFSYMCIAYGSTALAFMIYYCGVFVGRKIRFFATHKKLKLIIAGVLFAGFACFQLRFSKLELFDSFMQLLGVCGCLGTMDFVVKHLFGKISTDILMEAQKENIEQYFNEDSFTDRDKQMLREVLSGCKYEEIAINHNLSLSSVKKRLAYLYKKVGVTNQIDFIIKFTGKDVSSAAVTPDSTRV